MSFDLENMSLEDLKKLQTQVAKAISGFAEKQKQKAIEALDAKAREMGYSLAELTGLQTGRKRSAAVAKYANPANPSETWTGRGRKPRWFDAALKAGKSADDLRI